MKDIRQGLVIFAQQLTEREKWTCGDAPTWIIDTLVSKLEVLLREQVKDGELVQRVDAFLLGATRYVADQCGSECNTLLTAMDSLTSEFEAE
jgi:hypothetical protein